VSRSGQPDNEFVSAWERSPWNDAFLTDLAIHLLRSRRLGTGPGMDYLAVSFPSTDHAGHEYGPRSHEVQDTLLRFDANLGRLLDALDAQVGGQYVIGLSSDHGVSLIPEQVVAEGGDGGRISTTALRAAINGAVEQALAAPGPFVASIYEEQIALTPGVFDRLRATPGAIETVTRAIASVRGVAAAYSADDITLGRGDTDADPAVQAWRLSYVPGRSGDFALTPRPNWFVRSTSGTTHGTLHDYDQRVPLILAGAGIRPGQYAAPSTPADLVTTFAALAGIQMPRAQGRVLSEALRR
jgi:arylsulfatase A-like enzyme